MKTQKRTLYTLYVSIGIFLLSICIFQINQFNKKTQKIIEQVFLQAIDKDLFERLNASKANLIRVSGEINQTQEATTGIQIRSATCDTIIPYNRDVTREKILLDNRYIDQTMTRFVNPIQPESLEKRFTFLLDSFGIKAQTAITYYDKKEGKRYHSHSDMYLYTSSFHSNVISLGIEKEMEVQGFVRFTPCWLFQPIGKHIFYSLIFFGLFILFIIDFQLAISKRMITKYRSQKQPIQPRIILQPNGCYQIGTILLNTHNGILTTPKQSLNIGKRQEYILLKAFLEAPHFQLSREKVYSILKKADEKYSNQVNMVISRLRKLLEDDPNIKLELLNEEVYRLSCV